jgi:hypothetical protein
MEAFLKIRTKDGVEIDAKHAMTPKKKKSVTKKVSKQKVPKGASATNEEYAKFIPIKSPDVSTIPTPWEDDADDDELSAAVQLNDDDKFETENDIYLKQDLEWNELMKEADTVQDDDDAASDIPDKDDTSSSSNVQDDEESDINSDVTYTDSDIEDCDIFHGIKETKSTSKPIKVYSGIPIDFDDSD